MVDFPADPTGATTKPIQSSLSPGEIAGPYSLFAHGLAKTGEAAETVASSMADQTGLTAVTRDAEGNIKVDKAPYVGAAAVHQANAVKFGAVVMAEGEARRKDIELRTQFHDNPEGYRQAADAFMSSMQDQYTKAAGPLVGMTIRKVLEPTTTQTYKGLLNEKERLDLHRSVAAIDSEVDFTQNQMYALARGGVTSGPEWDQAWDKIKTLTGQKVGNPRLAYPSVKANNELSQFDTELRIQAATHRIVDEVYPDKSVDEKGNPRGGYDNALKMAGSLRTDPSLNMTPAQREASYHRVVAELNTKARDDTRVLKGVASDINSITDSATRGYPQSPDRIGKIRAAVAETGNPELHAAQQEAEEIAHTMLDWRKLSPAQLEATITNIDQTMRDKGETPIGRTLVDAGGKLLKEMRTQVGADPLGWSDRTGVMAVPPILFGSADAPGQMTDRASRAEIIGQHYGITPTYLRPDEKEALQTATAKGGPEMKAVAKTIVEGFGARAPQVMAELSKDAPTLAHVGALVMSGGNEGFTSDVVDGIKLRSDPGFKVPHWMDKPSDMILAAQGARSRDIYGSAFALLPDSGRRAQEAANNAFFMRAYRNGYDPALGKGGKALPGVDTSNSEAAYDKALQESVGARVVGGVQYGGVETYGTHGIYGWRTFDKVLVPANVRADRFRDVIGAITDEDLRKVAVSPESAKAADLRNAVPIKVDGGYVFAQGDPKSDSPKYIRGALGGPFKLDFDQMESTLRKRVPDAFLGGR